MLKVQPTEQIQLILEALALAQLQQICDINPEGIQIINTIRARMALEQIRIKAEIVPDLIMEYLMEKYQDGPPNPTKTNSGL